MSELHYTDAEKIKRLTAWHESEKAEIEQLRATIARLTTAHEMQGESLVVLPRWMVSNMEDKLKAQAEEIRILKQEIEERIEEEATRARES